MSPEGAKWVKNPQNRKNTRKKHLWLAGKKILKNQQKIKTGNPGKGFCLPRGPSIIMGEKLDF